MPHLLEDKRRYWLRVATYITMFAILSSLLQILRSPQSVRYTSAFWKSPWRESAIDMEDSSAA
jgi:hypothetical protein